MVELSDPKGPVKEGIDNSIFFAPGIIIVLLVGRFLQLLSSMVEANCRILRSQFTPTSEYTTMQFTTI